MDNSNSLTGSILQSNDISFPSESLASTASSGESTGFFGFFGNITITTWLIIILILAFLGFNIFVYLAKGTQDITNFFSPILQTLFGTAATTAGQVVDVSAEGAKAVVRGTSGALESGLNAVQSVSPNSAHSSVKSHPVEEPHDGGSNNMLNKNLNTSQQHDQHDQQEQPENQYEADVAPSSVHGEKAGWCYIGEDSGYRTCAHVGADDKCMSGDIFPSQDICMNPSLRA